MSWCNRLFKYAIKWAIKRPRRMVKPNKGDTKHRYAPGGLLAWAIGMIARVQRAMGIGSIVVAD